MPLPRTSRSIGFWLEQAAAKQGLQLDPLHLPFRSVQGREPPLLKPNGIPNHFVVYPGSFNPPHQGHKALLDHVLHNAGSDLSLVGAVIVLTDDDSLAAKNSRDDRPFTLSKEKRVRLWREASLPWDRVWIFGGSKDSWTKLMAQLQGLLVSIGIDLSLLLLVGPDWITARSVTDPKSWGCLEAVTSDVSRPVDFRYPHSLRQLPVCSPWVPCSHRLDAQPDTSMAACPVTSNRSRAVEMGTTPAAAVWVCRTLRKPLRRYRFVPSDTPASQKAAAPSSTEIRRVIASHQGQDLQEKLQHVALGVGLLAQYVLEGGPYSVPVAQELAPDHEARKSQTHELARW